MFQVHGPVATPRCHFVPGDMTDEEDNDDEDEDGGQVHFSLHLLLPRTGRFLFLLLFGGF